MRKTELMGLLENVPDNAEIVMDVGSRKYEIIGGNKTCCNYLGEKKDGWVLNLNVNTTEKEIKENIGEERKEKIDRLRAAYKIKILEHDHLKRLLDETRWITYGQPKWAKYITTLDGQIERFQKEADKIFNEIIEEVRKS